MLEAAGHRVDYYEIVRDDREKISAALVNNLENLDAIIVNGGTGITARDNTTEVVKSLLDKELEGFGELFRMLSFNEIGAGRDDEPRDCRRPSRQIYRRAARLDRRVPACDGEAAAPAARPHHLSAEQMKP